ncbi:MAG: hypothetical protein ACKPBU_02855 [Alphaproteobacteria bacterium]
MAKRKKSGASGGRVVETAAAAGGPGDSTRREKIRHEMEDFAATAAFLVFAFCMFALNHALLARSFGQPSTLGQDLGFAVLNALITAKLILIGDLLGVAKRLQRKPLLLVTIYKTIMFAGFVVLCHAIEKSIEGLWHGERPIESLRAAISGPARLEVLSHLTALLATFLPFFALREVGQSLEPGRLARLFLHGEA